MELAAPKMMSLLLHLAVVCIHTGYAFPDASLTISSLRRPLGGDGPHVVQRQIELNWQPREDFSWIGLFTDSPPRKAIPEIEPLHRVKAADHPSGSFRTNIGLRRHSYPNGWNKDSTELPLHGDACMPFWIGAYNDNDDLLHSDCLKIRPTWMGDHRQKLASLALSDLFIPGTHNSASYNRKAMEHTGEVLGRYLLTQDTDVWGQLVYGIRFLDLHVLHYPRTEEAEKAAAARNDDRFRKVVNVDAVKSILEEITIYLKKANTEVVILDVHEFPIGFKEHSSNHRQLASLIHSIVGDFVLPFSNITYNTTLADVWKTGRNLIVTYNDPETVKEFDWLWGPVPHMWAKDQTAEDLKESMQHCVDNTKQYKNSTFWAAMAVLTPTHIDYMFGGARSIGELANNINRNLTQWFQNDWWKYTNIVATDYFLGNNIIDTAVKSCVDKANILAQAVSEEE